MSVAQSAQIITLYQGGAPPSDLATRLKIPRQRVIRVLKDNGVPIRPQGRPKGWRKLDEKELQRRRKAGLRARTWEQYRKFARLPKTYNVRLDRRYGVRLSCFQCGKRVSTGTGRIDGYVRQLCANCLRRLPG